jgi:hypothetical protein
VRAEKKWRQDLAKNELVEPLYKHNAVALACEYLSDADLRTLPCRIAQALELSIVYPPRQNANAGEDSKVVLVCYQIVKAATNANDQINNAQKQQIRDPLPPGIRLKPLLS